MVGERDDLGRALDHRRLDVALLEVLGGHADLRMQPADAEEHDIGADHSQRLDSGRTHRDERLGPKRPADDRHLETGVVGERQRDRRAGRDHVRAQVVTQRPRYLERGGPAVEHDDLVVVHAARGAARDRCFGLGRPACPRGKRRRVAVARQRAPVDAPQQTGLVELAQVAPDRVDGHAQLGGQIGGEHATLVTNAVQDQGSPLVGQHLPDLTCLCMIMHERA